MHAQDVQAALASVNAANISFNPITANNIARVLLAVAHKAHVPLSPVAALGMGEAADGDVRRCAADGAC